MLHYQIKAKSEAGKTAAIQVKESSIAFGTVTASNDTLPNPAELFLGAFAACVLKNVERFSGILKFSYTSATLEVRAVRLDKPPRMDSIDYTLTIYSSDPKLNTALLQKNLEKFGTIYNTMKLSCTISGTITTVTDV